MENRKIYRVRYYDGKEAFYSSDYLMHYGKRFQKWGERLYQYLDGKLTPLGKEHYRLMRLAKKINEKLFKPLPNTPDFSNPNMDKNHKLMLGSKPIEEMSTNEINEAYNRYQAIKRFEHMDDKFMHRIANSTLKSFECKLAEQLGQQAAGKVTHVLMKTTPFLAKEAVRSGVKMVKFILDPSINIGRAGAVL